MNDAQQLDKGVMADRENAHFLGKRGLGRYAHEEHMPQQVRAALAGEATSNKSEGLVPLLHSLLIKNNDIDIGYLCDPSAKHVWKLEGEGNHFCGYRNAQMLSRELQTKTVLQIQDMIESAWVAGHNAHGKVETGGIKDTRKHIGTSEVEALLQHLEVPYAAKIFSGEDAYLQLLDWTEAYFASNRADLRERGVLQTLLPPVYLQMPFHSVTIVGVYRTSSHRKLLVFDPGLRPPGGFRDSEQTQRIPSIWDEFKTLWRYRRGERYLRRHKDFEILQLLDSTP